MSKSDNLVECIHCSRKFQSEQERNEHAIMHWSLKPYGCEKCKFNAYERSDVEQHFIAAHPGACKSSSDVQQRVSVKAPTVKQELELSDKQHMTEVERLEPAEEEDPLLITPEPNVEFPENTAEVADAEKVDDVVELCDSDLVIVTKTDSNVPKETDVFCCEYCPFMTNSEMQVISHVTSVHEHMHIRFKTLNRVTCESNARDYVGCAICSETGSEIKIRQHHLEKHDGQTFLMYRFACLACGKKFLKMGGLKCHHNKQHSGSVLKYSSITSDVDPLPVRGAFGLMCYQCPECSYERTFPTNAIGNVRSHVRQHFKAYSCGICKTSKYKTRWEAVTHSNKEHPGQYEDIVYDTKVNEGYNRTMTHIISNAKSPNQTPVVVKATARKSTSAPTGRQDEYSFYGRRPEAVDLNKIMTSVEVNGMCLTMSAEKLSKIFDLDAHVILEDCNLSVNLSSLFDS